MTPAERRPAQAWYVVAGGRVWGPYGRERLDGFIAEGRVAAQTPVGEHPEGPFQPASRHPGLSDLFEEAARPRAAAPAAAAEPQAGAERPLVVWAAIDGHRLEGFEQLLGAFGAYAVLAPGLWLVRARMGPSALRNALSRRLAREEALLVLEAPLDRAAWFNLGPAEPALRRLWGSGSSAG